MPRPPKPAPADRIPAEVLLAAYRRGRFPMAHTRDDPDYYWIEPHLRGILPLFHFHVPRRLARTVRQDVYTVTVDTAFHEVMQACAAPGPGDRDNTWINPTIFNTYCHLHEIGIGHSVECWHDGALVGGLYGIEMGAAFFGESMFSLMRDASKVALVHLVARLRKGGFLLLDTQFITEHLTQFGATEIGQRDYKNHLDYTLQRKGNFYELGPAGAATSGLVVLQETTQTS